MSDHCFSRRDAFAGLFSSPALLRAQDQPAARAPLGPTAFTNMTVIDGTGAVLQNQTVTIRDDRIVAIGPAPWIALNGGERVVDGRGRYLIPGLCDAHTHVSYFKASALPVLLANGVTFIRDMGGILGDLDRWKSETDDGIRPGPRIFRVGPILNGKAFNEFQVVVADGAEARGAVRVLKNGKVDQVKVHAAITRAAYFGVQSECKQVALRYVGHRSESLRRYRR